jgi:hypothetical protein
MSKIEVTLQFTRHVTFHIDDTDDPAYAVTRAEGALMYDGRTPDDEDMPDLELEQIKIGDREVHIDSQIDWSGPKDARGLHGWKYYAYEGYRRQKIAEGRDRADVIRRAFAVEAGDPS